MSWQAGIYVAAAVIPLGAGLVQLAAGRWLGRRGALVATGAIATSFALSLLGLVIYLGSAEGIFSEHQAGAATAAHDQFGEPNPTKGHAPLTWTAGFDWVALGGGGDGMITIAPLTIPLAIAIDNLAALMFVMITFVATLVHIYSLAYMSEDPRFGRFFAYLSFFCAAMLGLVAASNIFLVFMCWELVGLCSYLLIGFWREDRKNVDAANKAFIVNRIGDVGMLIGMGLLWAHLGTFDIAEINGSLRDAEGGLHVATAEGTTVVTMGDPAQPRTMFGQPRQIPYSLLVVAGLGIFAGCVGKSAQFPLHVWLPDAMAGPTPVSALIHAATMVAAGVYLVGRFFPLFTPEVLLVIAYTGGITLFVAASVAMVQSDFKKVLAYSTVSQLGFMMLGLGVGGRAAGLFHLLTHACFKALLFLGAGSVYHAVHTYTMAELGGLYRRMRITGLTMLAATLAISGVPLFSGFASKDAILATSLHFVQRYPAHWLLFALPVVGAAMTAFYMVRMWFLLFAGEPRSAAADHAHDPGPLMAWPLIALAIPTVVIGWPITILPFFGFEPILEQMLRYGEPIRALDVGSAKWWALGASILIAAAGLGVGALFYGPWDAWRRLDARRLAERFGPVHRFVANGWYFDALYRVAVVTPTLLLARLTSWFDRAVLDRIVDGSAQLVVELSRFDGWFDRQVVDRAVDAVARGTIGAGEWARRLQGGQLRGYLMVLAAAVVGLSAALFVWILA
ncbi:NADH-quinone oxidoreductase subunit L [Tundrisphaera sp. TA3]|uniref:NADH-quinone oxidoreductase subunit L n=1 Tax=Tundrisphaera sp. TA3 TaxID=3435775 RepID=UPI003EBA303B